MAPTFKTDTPANERPPADQRIFGLDRRALWPTLAVLALALLWGALVPALNDSIEGDAIQPGTTLELQFDTTFEPAPGWLVDGAPMPASPRLRLFADGVSLEINSGLYSGTPGELLNDIQELRGGTEVAGAPRPFTTASGMPGTAIETTGGTHASALFTLVSDRQQRVEGIPEVGDPSSVGVQVIVEGPAEQLEQRTEEIGNMIASITQTRAPADTQESP